MWAARTKHARSRAYEPCVSTNFHPESSHQSDHRTWTRRPWTWKQMRSRKFDHFNPAPRWKNGIFTIFGCWFLWPGQLQRNNFLRSQYTTRWSIAKCEKKTNENIHIFLFFPIFSLPIFFHTLPIDPYRPLQPPPRTLRNPNHHPKIEHRFVHTDRQHNFRN